VRVEGAGIRDLAGSDQGDGFHSFIHSFILAISIAPLQVHYYSEDFVFVLAGEKTMLK